jgi:hypothetical protein
MTPRHLRIALVCAMSISAAKAQSIDKQQGQDSAASVQCTSDNSGHAACPEAEKRTESVAGVVDANGTPARLVTVPTAAGIDITVASSFAPAIQGFIADAVAAGYKPRRIKCYSLSRAHVRHSLHKVGEACDFNQHGWNKTDRFMYRVRKLAAKWGLRDGCSFRDCGHIDVGRVVTHAQRRRPRLASQ